MYRSSPARKYGPLALLAAAQLVVVLVAPSTAPTAQEDAFAGGGFDSGVAAVDDGTGGVVADGSGLGGGTTGVEVDPALGGAARTDTTAGGSTGGTSSGTTGSTGGASTGGTSTGGGSAGSGSTGGAAAGGTTTGGTGASGGGTAAAGATGSTAHCVSGRQYDPAVDFYAPPCVPGVPGAAVANPGATAQGVTKDKILIVHYVQDFGAEVNAILRAQGLYYDAGDARVVNAVFSKYMNQKFQLHGRKIEIRTFQGTCRTVPPDQQCLNAEMNRLAKEFKPYAVFFPGTVCSACYAELARNKVITFGGSGFSEEFRNALRPYNYDAGMSSTRMSRVFAEWWCNQLAGKPAIYAGAQNPAQDFRTTKRQLGVVSTNDPDNERVIRKVLYPALAKCGESVKGHEYFYEQNVGTAATQSQAGTAIMNSSTNPATSVVCFCDPVAPQFSYNAATNNNYWPEVLFASNQALDVDQVGQTYMGGLACPQARRGCAFDGALGLGQEDSSRPEASLAGVKVYKAGGGGSAPVGPLVLAGFWDDYNMFASLLQAAGPNLTPARMAQAAPTLGSRGGGDTARPRRAFEDGELSWTRDVRLTYWVKGKRSPFNNVNGTFTEASGGKRFGLGQFPRAAQPAVPTVDKRR